MPHVPSVSPLSGALRLLLFSTRLLRKTEQRRMFVELNVGRFCRLLGVGFGLCAELHEPSCGGGWSSLLSEFGDTPNVLLRNVEFLTVTRPPEFVPEYPSA